VVAIELLNTDDTDGTEYTDTATAWVCSSGAKLRR